ncbi:MAG: hypothetical protein ACLPKT_01245, partial [Methylocella sp.]
SIKRGGQLRLASPALSLPFDGGRAGRKEAMRMSVTESHTVNRGPETWTFIYIVLGFALSIEGTIMRMLPLPFPWNVIAYVILGLVTFRLFINYGPFQNWLVKIKTKYEGKAR